VLLLLGFVLACGNNSADPARRTPAGTKTAPTTAATKAKESSCCDGYEQGACFKYGGVYGSCNAAGVGFDAKIECALCCDGLTRATPMIETDDAFDGYPKGCGPTAPPSWFVCIACGDGKCGAGENRCECPEDCP
jgi:hypothetical protein